MLRFYCIIIQFSTHQRVIDYHHGVVITWLLLLTCTRQHTLEQIWKLKIIFI